MKHSGPHLALAILALCAACAGDAPALRRDVADLKAQLGRLEQRNATQGDQIRALAEKVASLQASPMVVLAPPAAPPRVPSAAPRATAEPLVPPGLDVVKLEPEPDAEVARPAPRPRARGRTPPPVPTSVPLVVPEGALP